MDLAILPKVAGEYIKDAPLAPLTTLKVGGNAEVLFKPANWADLSIFIKNLGSSNKVTIIGDGSNMLISDDGVSGIVILIGEELAKVEINDNEIYAEAGASSGSVARAARKYELTGAEFLCGIPGSIGGALKMNAGAYGAETFDIAKEVYVITNDGETKTLSPVEVGFSYRKTNLPVGWVFKGATFQLKPGNKDDIRNKMREINKNRSTSQPLDMPSSGSWFKNYVDENGVKHSAWKLADEAGCRGLKVGGAQVSEKHSNFFINAGGATCADFLELSDLVAAKIKEFHGADMVREVRVIE